MSSPLASLGKTRRVPLQSEPVNPGRRNLKVYGDEDEVDVLSDGHESEEKIVVPACYGRIGAPVSRQVPVLHDSELTTSLMSNMKDLERQVKAQTDEMLTKDRKIQALEELVQTLQEHQGDSLAPPEVDFDRLLASLKDLSELVVEGDTHVTPVPGGARLRTLEPIPVKLYQNGIVMFEGPFRPFCDPATQRCLRDIFDGFFPSELQRLYPDGVPFKVSDLRNQVYPENGQDLFPGEGRTVGRTIRKASDKMEHPGSGMTAEKFLNRLPKIVIREGKVVDIRGPIRDTLQNCCPLPARIQEIVVETPALVAERERSQKARELPSRPLSMLRIKSENGEQVFLLMMRPEDTVGDVRTLLAQARAVDAAAFEIFSTFPPMVYHDDALTLQVAGLVPNAVLLLRPRRSQLPAPSPK
ncbi:PREDICTED: UBX domain-containing protein 11 isoform X2 [Condylura cristata]|uniref:UBX domain-containing protein 11 isoform X2 n=1 Tax=Condylura cristata TaxID=143302 RepID=UPI000643BBC2|nr:PREDICTED: UBX domain-containing protein 11 isoform X2 [Condylura cristata]